ncbi:MAG: ATP-binding cassette domain-containing protein [Alicyclobacillus macrosporangiidus]|uniref:ABC transporter ATP-binding protein n=1 Tax=Alicyclobacillus macrosporangiidus TaxID=392015 RepID=UPI0026F18A18|nr:ABC transporter transmembrane domain-containing protein [Alicyclobacillus macrosporangiidus]MCL6598076.1 ATP-binding cassette domain-containing protein [Alicyclobacillus macrosporangiidus]
MASVTTDDRPSAAGTRTAARSGPVLRRLLAYAKPHRKTLAIALTLLGLATAADVINPVLTKVFIDDYLTPRRFPAGPLAVLGGGYLALLTATVVLNYLQLVLFQTVALRIVQQLRVDVFHHVQGLGLSFFDRTPAGALISRITNDTEAVKDLFVSVLSTFVQNTVLLAGIFASMFALDARLAAFCLLLAPIIGLAMAVYGRLSGPVFQRTREWLSQLNTRLSESLQGMHVIQALGQEERMRRVFAEINQAHFLARLQTIRLNGWLLRPLVDLIYTAALMLVLTWFGLQSLTGPVEVGVLYVFVNYLDRFFEPVNQMMMRLNLFQQAIVSAKRVFDLLDDTSFAPGKTGDGAPRITQGHIRFENVRFSYDGETDVLDGISFEVQPGQTVALVGHTGSGKSSIVNLLMRFYPLEHGRITIDGWPLETFSDEELRRKVGLVLQDPFLFTGDVMENIRLHRPEVSEADAVAAARFVQAHPFIERLPEGYRTAVGERGATFSAGQRQLLSFARTMAGDPVILVLDEATASIDTETEEAIQSALAKMRRGRTTLAIAHRLSTIQDADRILVLHRGRIVEEGTHQELLALGGLYHKMYLLQQGGPRLEAATATEGD